MKSNFSQILLMIILSAFVGTMYAEQSNSEVRGAHPWKIVENKEVAQEISHWSLLIDAGFNSFDGDFNNSETKFPVWAPSASLGVEYSFTPFIGLGLDYRFDWYRITGTGNGDNADILLEGLLHRADAYLTIDLMSAFTTHAKSKLAAIQLFAGGGLAFYNNSTYYDGQYRGMTAQGEKKSEDGFTFVPYVAIGVGVEFNISRSIALGIKGQYAYFTKDDIDHRTPILRNGQLVNGASTNNDGIIDVTLSLRYKIDAVHKTHIRNIPSENFLNEQRHKKELDNLRDELANSPAKRDTIVVVHHDTIFSISEKALPAQEYYYIYFDNNKSTLTDKAYIAIQQVADRFESSENRYITIAGFCDNTGTATLNERLSNARVASVEQELIAEYGIDADHIATCGRGALVSKSRKTGFAANRRVEVRFVTEKEFEAFQSACEHHKNDPAAQKAVENRKATSDLSTADSITTKTVTGGTTLAKLAREYYGNTHCWIYLYYVNRKVISNPSVLAAGTTLVIPTLTDEQRNITKDECLNLYKALRAEK